VDFRHLEYFKAVVEAGSVSRAAANLNMSQPPLSATIAKLERELGVQLLERTAKGVHPTNAGLFLLSKGTRLMSDRDRLAGTLALMGEGLVGGLHIGVEPMVINEIIANVLAGFLIEAPGARVRLTDVPPDSILNGLRSGELDMACVPFSPDEFADFVTGFCEFEPIIEIGIKLAVPTARANEYHPDGRGWGRWILPLRLAAFRGMPDTVDQYLRDDPTFEVLEVSTPQTSLPFVAAGLGVAPITERIGEQYDGVTLLPAPAWLPPMQATLLWRRGSEVTPLMRRWMAVTKRVAVSRAGS
jgi:DNA-binding transcriptional LysR family regulator